MIASVRSARSQFDNGSPRTESGKTRLTGQALNNRAPCNTRFKLTKDERKQWDLRRAQFSQQAAKGLTVKESLAITRDPRWRWQAAKK